MSNVLQVCLYNAEQESSEPLRQSISQLNFVRLVAEASTPEHLATALNDAGVQLVFFHMDPDPAPVIDLIDQVSQRFPEVALIASATMPARRRFSPRSAPGVINSSANRLITQSLPRRSAGWPAAVS